MRWMVTIFAILCLLFAVAVINLNFTQKSDTILPMSTAFTLSSSAFEEGQMIPQKYACDGESISPPLSIQDAPEGTQSFALIVEDPDIPQVYKDQMKINEFVHWVLFDIPATSTTIAENATAGIEGNNGSGKLGYAPPCPPKQYEPSKHRYVFHLYALDSMLGLQAGATKDDVTKAIQGHILGEADLTGVYQQQ